MPWVPPGTTANRGRLSAFARKPETGIGKRALHENANGKPAELAAARAWLYMAQQQADSGISSGPRPKTTDRKAL